MGVARGDGDADPRAGRGDGLETGADPDAPWTRDYVSACDHQGGLVIFKDIDLAWADTYKCGLGKHEPWCV